MNRLRRGRGLVVVALVLWSVFAGCARGGPGRDEAGSAGRGERVAVKRGVFRQTLRLSGTVEAVHSRSIQAPRLTGQMASLMVITRIIPNGTRVRTGDILVEFDRQSQLRTIQDREAERDNLVQQIRKKEADHAAARAADETGLRDAEVGVLAARVEMRKNEVVPSYQAEIHKVNLEEAEARLALLRDTLALRQEARAAETRILEIQRDRAQRAVEYAGRNTADMEVRSPISGLAVLTPVSRGSQRTDPQEGDEVRSGSTVMTVVDPSAMQVTARVNQVDIAGVRLGQAAEVRLDAYPGLVFPGRVERIGSFGTSSTYLKRIRYFSVTISILGSDPKLLPDLTAAVDLEFARVDGCLLLPREAVVLRDGKALVEVVGNNGPGPLEVEPGPMNESEIVIRSGVGAGTVVALHPRVPVPARAREQER